MIKCRVRQKGRNYYPQYKWFIFWLPAPKIEWDKFIPNESEIKLKYRNLFAIGTCIRIYNIRFEVYTDLDAAETCLKNFVCSNQKVDCYKGHNIHQNSVCYYDKSFKVRYKGYTIYPIVDYSVQQLIRKIDTFENNKSIIKSKKVYTYDE